MARLTIGQKSERVLRFLRGLSEPRVAAALLPYGFSQADWDEGWQLLREAAGNRLAVSTPPPPDPTVLEQLDAWENRWFPVVGASLRRHHGEVFEKLFLNLSQAEGLEVTMTVSTLLSRLEEIQQSPEGKAALALLEKRGFTAAQHAEAKALLQQFGQIVPESPAPEQAAEERERAEAALWDWYLEWSTIARSVVKGRRQLLQLGFLSSSSSSSSGEPEAPPVSEITGEEDDESIVVAS